MADSKTKRQINAKDTAKVILKKKSQAGGLSY